MPTLFLSLYQLKQEIERTYPKAISDEGATKQGIKEQTGTLIISSASKKDATCSKKPKLSNNTSAPHTHGTTGAGDVSSTALASKSFRCDRSLGSLTKTFIDLLEQAEDGVLNLNKAAQIMKVKKRRIYDITNVLQGTGLIESTLKNNIRWRESDMLRPTELKAEISKFEDENRSLSKEENKLDQMISEMQDEISSMTEDVNNQKLLHLTSKDIKSLPYLKDSTLIAIKAPRGSILEVPNPDEDFDFLEKRNQIILRSCMGPIECYLITNSGERDEPSQQTDKDTNETSEPGERQDSLKISSGSICTREWDSSFVKIIPSYDDEDADYWLRSDYGYSVTDLWSN